MDGGFKGGDQQHPLLDLIPEEVWMDKKDLREGGGDAYGVAEERKLELRLGPPGEQWLSSREKSEEGLSSEPRLSLLANNYHPCVGTKRGGFFITEVLQQQQQQRFLQSKSGSGKELSQKEKGKEVHCTPPPPPPPHGSQTRVISTPVVGWPPIRSFRRNLASSSSKLSHESRNGDMEPSPRVEPDTKGLFVKINMDGIPIGRKVDLKAYDSYEKLSLSVDKLFQGLIAAQRGTLAAVDLNDAVEMHALTGLLEGSGEYTLVYEDDEGDRMLVGDVPWDMFISTAKRLRVLKSSDLLALSFGARKKNSNRG